jgi:hypothetical protein
MVSRLQHPGEHVEVSTAGRVFGHAMLGIILGVPVLCIVQLVVYRPRPSTSLPPARLVSR